MKVPTAERQVSKNLGNIPKLPSISTGGPTAYGVGVAQAGEELASTVSSSVQKLAKQREANKKREDAALNARLLNDFKNRNQDQLYSQEEITKNIGGVDYKMLKGAKLREEWQANGITKDYDDFYANNQNEFLEKSNDPESLYLQMEAIKQATLPRIGMHEVAQAKADQDNSYKTIIGGNIVKCYDAISPKELSTLFDESEYYQKKLDPDGVEGVFNKMADKAISGAVMRDPSGFEANALLLVMEKKISKEQSDKLQTSIDKKTSTMRQNLKTQEKKQQYVVGTDLVNKLSNNEIGLSDEESIKDMGVKREISQELTNAVIKTIYNPISEFDDEGKDAAFTDLVKAIISDTDIDRKNKNLVDILNGFTGGDLSQRRLQLLVQTAAEMGVGVKAGDTKKIEFKQNMDAVWDWADEVGIDKSQMTEDLLETMMQEYDPKTVIEEMKLKEIERQNNSKEKEIKLDENLSQQIDVNNDLETSLKDSEKDVYQYLLKTGIEKNEAASTAQGIFASGDVMDISEKMSKAMPELKYSMPKTQEAIEKYGFFDEVLGLLSPISEAQAAEVDGYSGNLDLKNRPILNNEDGSISNEKSFSIDINGKEILIPLIVNGKELSQEEAIQHYQETGENLGEFDSIEEANSMAEKIHSRDIKKDKPKVEEKPVYENRSLSAKDVQSFLSIDEKGKPVNNGLITFHSSSGNIGRKGDETGLEGFKESTVQYMKSFTSKYDIPITVTGGTEYGPHLEDIRYPHTKGYKFDVRNKTNRTKNKEEKKNIRDLNTLVKSWAKVGKRPFDDAVGYKDPDNSVMFWVEDDHWDVEVRPENEPMQIYEADIDGKYYPPLNDEDRARAVVEGIYREKGKKIPLSLKEDWAVDSQQGRAITSGLIWTVLTAGAYPIVEGVTGLVEKTPDLDTFNKVTKGILYPQNTKRIYEKFTDVEKLPMWARITADVSETILKYGALGLAKVGVNAVKNRLVARSIGRNIEVASEKLATQVYGKAPKGKGTVSSADTQRMLQRDMMKEEYKQMYVANLHAIDSKTLKTGFQEFGESRSMLRMVADEISLGNVPVGLSIKPVKGNEVMFSHAGKLMKGIVKEINKNTVKIATTEGIITSTIPQIVTSVGDTIASNQEGATKKLSKEATGDGSLIDEAKKYKSAEEFVESQIAREYSDAHQVDTAQSDSISNIKESKIDEFIEEYRRQYGYPSLKSKEVNKLKKLLGDPNKEVTIYRASPKEELNSGDWVTIDRDYANDIKRQNGGKVYKYTVKAGDLFYPKTLEAYKDLPSLNKWGAFQYQSGETKQQLTDIYNKANKQDSLEEEAKKYKTVEEFINSKKKDIVYHGSNEALEKFEDSGAFFTDDMMNAEGYGNGENLYEGYLDMKNPLIIDANGRHHSDLKTPYGTSTQEIVEKVDSKKYDGVIFKNIDDSFADDMGDIVGSDTIFYPFNANKSFINESQLTDIYNKANKGADPLITEAKKYKSAEEFVGSKGKPLYHGTNKEFTVFGEKEGTGKGATTLGSWFTSNRKQAEAIAEGQSKNSLIIEGKKTNANVVEAYADVKNTKTIDMKKEQLLPDDANNIVLQAKKDGFDSVVFKNTLVVDGVFADHTVIINPKDIKTKNQLEDVWNKSQAKNSLEQDKKKLEDFINKRADELEGTIFAPKGNRDAALKKVSEEFQKGEVPDEMDELSMQFLKSTKDLETGEIIDITSEDFPRTGTLLNFLNSQQDDIYNKAKVDKVAEKPIALNKEEVNPKSIKAVDGKSKLDAKIEGLKDQKLIGEQAKDALDYVKQLQNDLKNSVRAYKDGKLQEEYEGIPAKYRTTNKNANGMDEVASELGISENELSGYLQDLDNQSDRLKQTIEDNKTRFIKKAEITTLKQKVKDIESGIRQGKKLATDKIKDMQSELIENINAYKMEAKDKAKLLATVKNANTDEKLIKALKSVEERATKFAESSEKHKIIDNIKKELKTTKPIKKGQRTVGRYEYDTNKIFDSIREGNKLTKEQAQAMLDSIPDDANTELDLIKKRLLSLKANGMDSSVELFRQVQKDIKRLKLEGARSKNEVDFMERMEYKEQKQEIVDEMDRVKPEDVINWKTRAFNFYRKGLSNYQSLLNSIAGKETSEKYDLQSAEAEYTTKIQEKTRKISEDSAKILGINDRDYLRLISEASENKYKLYENKENGNIYNMSILDIIDIYNGIKNEHTKERAYDVYGEEQVNDMLNLLSDEQKEMANYWQEVAQSNKNTYNQYLIDTTGRDMGEVENYWMRTSELDIDINNDLIMQSNIPSAAKARSAGNIVPIFKNALSKLMKNVNDAQYIESLNDKYIEAKKMFSDRKVKNMIENKYGADIYQNLMKKIDMLSLQGKQDDADFISSLFNGALNGWVIAKIGLSESVLVKQLISMGNYMENMKAVDWTKGFGEGLKNPKQTFDFMWNNSSYIRERFKRGYNEAVQIALNEANTLKSFRGDVFKFVSFFARAGDITAIIYGGYPLVQQQLAEGKTMEEAMEVFTLATVKAQQSGLVSSRSDFQNSKNGFARIFLAFKNTVNQYTRKMVDATVMYKNGDIDAKQYGKVMSIYGVIQPALFGATSHVVGSNMYKMISSLLKGDDDEDADYLPDLLKTMILSIATNPVNAIPFLRDSVEYGARKLLDMNTYDPFSMGIIDDLRRSWQKMGKDDKNALDYFEMLGGVVEPVIGVPIKRPVRIIKNLAGIRRFDHVSTAHANFVERFGKIKKVRKQVKKAEDKNDQKKVKKIKSDNKEILNKYDTMNSYYKEIASIKKDINNINKKKSLSSNDKERINKLKSKITEKAKKAIQYYDNRR